MRPDAGARFEILKVHARGKPLEEDVDLRQVANDLPGAQMATPLRWPVLFRTP